MSTTEDYCEKSELQHQFKIPCQNQIESSCFIEYMTRSALSDAANQPLEFQIPADSSAFIDPSEIYLKVVAKMKTATGDIEQTVQGTCDNIYAPINLALSSCFDNCDFIVGRTNINLEQGNFALVNHFKTLVSASPLVKDTRLLLAGYTGHEAGLISTTSKAGHDKRAKMFDLSRPVELMARLETDLTGTSQLLPSQLGIMIRLTRASAAYSCMAIGAGAGKQACHIEIQEASLLVRRVTLSPQAQLTKIAELNNAPFHYQFNRLVTRTYQIPQSQTAAVFENIFNTKLPSHLFFVMIDAGAYHGDYTLNPHHYQHFNLKKASVRVENQIFPSVDEDLDFTGYGRVNTYYHHLMEALGFDAGQMQTGNGMTRDDLVKNSNFVLGFNLTADGVPIGANTSANQDTGLLRLSLEFGTPLSKAVTLVVFGVFPSELKIDRNRDVWF